MFYKGEESPRDMAVQPADLTEAIKASSPQKNEVWGNLHLVFRYFGVFLMPVDDASARQIVG